MEKKLYKSSTNKVLTGTCGGIGEYFNIDPTLVRLIFIAIIFAGGSGVLIYIVAALIMPKYPAEDFDHFENMENANPDYKARPKKKNKVASGDDDFDSYFEK